MVEPGKIRYPDYRQRLLDVTGLRYGRITPGDIDSILDFRGQYFVFIELKYGSSKPGVGQRLLLEHLVDAIHNPGSGKYAVAFVCNYNESHFNEDGEIVVARTPITTVRWAHRWQKPHHAGFPLVRGISAIAITCFPNTWWESFKVQGA